MELLRSQRIRAMWRDRIGEDLASARRQLRHRRSMSAVMITLAAIAVAAVICASALLLDTILRPLPLPEGDRVVAIHTRDTRHPPEARRGSAAPGDMMDWRTLSAFSAVVALNNSELTLLSGAEPQRITAVLTSEGLDVLLGVAPHLGRLFTPYDHTPESPSVLLLSWEFWMNELGGDSTVVGRTLQFAGGPSEVIGVLPPLPRLAWDRAGDVWFPFNPAGNPTRGGTWLRVVARLRPDVTMESAQAELDAKMSALAVAEPRTNSTRTAWMEPVDHALTWRSRPVLYFIAGAVALVLLIAAANVAALLLAQASSREEEMAVRAALGASARRLDRQLFVETGVCALIGTAIGVWASNAVLKLFLHVYPGGLPRADEVAVGAESVLLAAAVAITFTVLGVVPVRRMVRSLSRRGLRVSGTRTGDRAAGTFRTLLTAGQVAFCTALLIAGVLLLRVYRELTATPTGFDAQGVVAFQLTPPTYRYRSQSEYLDFYDELLRRIRSQPGITAAAYTSLLPYHPDNLTEGLFPEGMPETAENETFVLYQRVEPSYPHMLGVPLLEGRALTESDANAEHPVALIDEMLAQKWFGDASAIGRRIGRNGRWMEVVGVVGAKRHRNLATDPLPELYVPRRQETQGRTLWVVARTTEPPELVLSQLRATLRQLDSAVPFSHETVLANSIQESIAPERFRSLLLASLAAIALLLATVGVWSLAAYRVSRQSREIGIRMALGMRPAQARTLVLMQAATIAAAGAAAGVLGAILAARLFDTQMFGVPSVDARTAAAVAAFMTLLSALAVLRPAWRASAIDPARAMRAP